jgi:hypothetical protein
MNRDLLGDFDRAIRALGKNIFPDDADISLIIPAETVDYSLWDVLVAVDYGGETGGTMIYRSSLEVASYLTLVFFGVFVGEDREIAADGAAEFLNQLFGMVKRNVSAVAGEFSFSLPQRIVYEKPLANIFTVTECFQVSTPSKTLYLDICRVR